MSDNSNTNSKPLFNLPMDELRDKAIINLAAFSNSPSAKIVLTGDPQIHYDYFMGTSIAFSGAEAVPKQQFSLIAGNGLSAEVWFNIDKADYYDSVYQQLFSLNTVITGKTGGQFDVHLYGNGSKLYLKILGIDGNEELLNTPIAPERWVHLALVVNPDNYLRCFIDNIPVEINLEGFEDYPEPASSDTLTIGASDEAQQRYFLKGKLCQFKLYNAVLTDTEVDLSFKRGKNANATFKSTYPIDVTLNTIDNGNELPVLYIGDGTTAHQLKLSIINVSGTEMVFKQIRVSPSDYHLQLRFKKQVLDAKTIAYIKENSRYEKWTCLIGEDNEFKEDWISFSCEGIEGFSGVLDILLNNMQAAASTGARNTAVEVRYNNIRYKDSEDTLNGSLTRHLDIIGYGGRSMQPFEAVMAGPAELLKNEPGSFNIAMRNITGKTLRFKPDGGDRPSRIIISVQEEVVKTPNAKFSENAFVPRNEIQSGNWRQSFECNRDRTTLGAGHELKLHVSDFKTRRSASGTVNIYINYQNIPGFADGFFTVAIKWTNWIEEDNKVFIGKGANEAGREEEEQKKDVVLDVNGRITDMTGFLMPVGAIIAYGGQEVPLGWLLCNGDPVPHGDKYEQLRAVLGYGKPTPDLRSRFIVGANKNDRDFVPATTGGQKEITLQESQMPRHKHTADTSTANIYKGDAGDYVLMPKGSYIRHASDGGITIMDRNAKGPVLLQDALEQYHAHRVDIGYTGGGQPHDNLPPYYALTYIIKY